MDIQQYIASGILEQYVLGAASPDEQREVERLALEHPEIRSEITAIEASLESFAQAHAIEPPVDTLGRVLDQLGGSATASAYGHRRPQVSSNRTPRWIWLTLAATMAAVVWALSLYNALTNAKADYDGLQTRYEPTGR